MSYDQILPTVVSAIGVAIALYLVRKLIIFVESGVAFFRAKEEQAKTITIDSVKKTAVDLAVMKTEQMVVIPAKKTGAWTDLGQRQHARDYAVEAATKYLERRAIVSPPEELVAMIEARVAEAKIQVRAMSEQAGKESMS